MPALKIRKLTLLSIGLLIGLLVSGCGIYASHGYGRVAAMPSGRTAEIPLALPENAPSISQRFRREGASSKSEHRGFDILVPSATAVLAAADGRVSRVQTSLLYGRQVMIDHAAVAAGFPVQTRYFHLSEQRVVVGDVVSRGQLIAYSGLSGMAGAFPHLHFEVHRLDEQESPNAIGVLDPQRFWVDGEGRITCFDTGREWPGTPVVLTYPVPCRGLQWSE